MKLFESPDFYDAIVAGTAHFQGSGLTEQLIEKDYYVKDFAYQRLAETITYLEQDEANRLLQGIDNSDELKLVRDRLLLGLMTIEGTRTVELYRCNIEDIKRLGKEIGLKFKASARVVRSCGSADDGDLYACRG